MKAVRQEKVSVQEGQQGGQCGWKSEWQAVLGGAGDGHLILQVLASWVTHQSPLPPPPDICTTC